MTKKAVNRIKQPVKEKKRLLPEFNFHLKVGNTVKGILGGEVLKNPTIRFYPFLIYLTLLGLVYIANNYNVESKIRRMNKLHSEIKELNYEYVTGKAKLEEMTKQSELARQLEKSGIKESVEPLKVIVLNKESK